MKRWCLVIALATACSHAPRRSDEPRDDGTPRAAREPAAVSATPIGVPAAGTAVCGRRAHDKIVARKSTYTYEATCDQRQTTWANVPHEHRACSTDADCVAVLRNANCDVFPLAKSAENLPEYAQGPCVAPTQGFCAGDPPTATCVAGCCNLTGMYPWGAIEVAYPRP